MSRRSAFVSWDNYFQTRDTLPEQHNALKRKDIILVTKPSLVLMLIEILDLSNLWTVRVITAYVNKSALSYTSLEDDGR